MTEPATPPLDPDADGPTARVRPIGRSGSGRPLHLRASWLLLVAAGGAVGTAAREALALAIPSLSGLPLAILLINLAGAFGLGILLEALARRGADAGRRRLLRLLVGTGFFGGFTTYSALATGTVTLIVSGQVALGVGYALVTVIVGALATFLGILVGAATHRGGDAE